MRRLSFAIGAFALGLWACAEPADPPAAVTDTSLADGRGDDVTNDAVADTTVPDVGFDSGSDPGVGGDDTDVPAVDTATADLGVDLGSDPGTDPGTDAAAEVVADVPPPSFNGEPPTGATTVASFSGVQDSTGAAVGPTDLIGHWTVMWFYPAASTSG